MSYALKGKKTQRGSSKQHGGVPERNICKLYRIYSMLSYRPTASASCHLFVAQEHERESPVENFCCNELTFATETKRLFTTNPRICLSFAFTTSEWEKHIGFKGVLFIY